jgi:DNA-directed RNA polymerase specialized sigma24 family protein
LAVSEDRVAAFLETHRAYRDALQEVKLLERLRDEPLLASSRDLPIPELAAATGLSPDRVRRITDRARRASRSVVFAARTR